MASELASGETRCENTDDNGLQCKNTSGFTRKGDDKPLCWDCCTLLAGRGELREASVLPTPVRYSPDKLREAIETCDGNIQMFEAGIIEQRRLKDEYWSLLSGMGEAGPKPVS